MAKGDTKTNQYLDIAANGTRADLPTDTCCETRSQTLIREVAERIMDVEDEVEEIKNNPDVVDIVPTYAALQNYDTSGLTDKDIIRVLSDETHDGDSTYYRYNAQSGTWTYVGESKQYEDFVGTDGTAGGQNGLVPAPVATDAGKFLNANGSWEEVQAGGVTELTTADYNWPTNNPDGVALWLLDEGIYTRSSSVKVYLSTRRIVDTQYQEFIITPAESSGSAPVMGIVYLNHANPTMYYAVVNTNGAEIGSPVVLLTSNAISQSTGTFTNTVMSQNATTVALNQISIAGSGAPASTKVGSVGQLYRDTANGKLYICTDATNPYIWEEVGAGGGSGPTVVQTTGTSTTDVMSQNAVTSMVFADPATQYKIKIGAGTLSSEGNDAVEIGHNAYAEAENAITLGRNAGARSTATGGVAVGANSFTNGIGQIALGAASGGNDTTQGIMFIGPNNTYYGYNNTKYRLLTGLYDPQSAHDAATKGYVDPTTDSSAPTTATVGRLGQIYIDTTNADAYMCVAVDTVTPSYTWKKITA